MSHRINGVYLLTFSIQIKHLPSGAVQLFTIPPGWFSPNLRAKRQPLRRQICPGQMAIEFHSSWHTCSFRWRFCIVDRFKFQPSKKHMYTYEYLVGGLNPPEKYYSNWIIFQGRCENKKWLKPPPRYAYIYIHSTKQSPTNQQHLFIANWIHCHRKSPFESSTVFAA